MSADQTHASGLLLHVAELESELIAATSGQGGTSTLPWCYSEPYLQSNFLPSTTIVPSTQLARSLWF